MASLGDLVHDVLDLIGNLVLGHGEVSKGQVGSISLLVDGLKLLNQGLVGLVNRGLASYDLLSGSSGIFGLGPDCLLVLLNLGLHLLEGIDPLLHSQSGIALNTGLLLLAVLLGLGNQRLLVIQLGRQHVDILLLGSNDVLNVLFYLSRSFTVS